MDQYTNLKIKTFRERFIELCEENPKNDTALAKALHVSKQTISAWKIGTRSPKAPTIAAISEYFGVTIEWLMGFDVEKAKKKPDQDKIAIVIPDSELFKKVLLYMPDDDYAMVMEAFLRTEKIMKDRGIPLYD